MTPSLSKVITDTAVSSRRVMELFNEQRQNIIRHTSHLFSWLMTFQWFFAVVLALWLSPRTWTGTTQSNSSTCLGRHLPGRNYHQSSGLYGAKVPRRHFDPPYHCHRPNAHVSLLIHLTGGRIETHFHVFGSLAILAFYRDWKVLISASAVVYMDHLLRGFSGRNLFMACFRHPFGGLWNTPAGSCLR